MRMMRFILWNCNFKIKTKFDEFHFLIENNQTGYLLESKFPNCLR
jgi:hypothetical protein